MKHIQNTAMSLPDSSDRIMKSEKDDIVCPSTSSIHKGNTSSTVLPSAWGNSKCVEQLQDERRNKKPFFYCRLVTTYPRTTFAVTLGCHLLMVFVSGVLFVSGFELFPTNFEKLPMELYTIPYRLRDYAWRDRNLYSNRFFRTLTDTGVATQERGLASTFSSISLYYDTDGGNVFTKTHLTKIQSIENKLASIGRYKQSFCMTYNTSLQCQPFDSIIRFFDGTYQDVDPIFNDPTFSDIPGVLYAAYNNNQTQTKIKYFLPKSYTLTQTSASGSLTRSLMQIGCTVGGQTKCNTDSWKSTVQTYLSDNVKSELEAIRKETKQFDFYYNSVNLWLYDVQKQAILDMMCAVGSMLFIFSFMIFHTRSLWVTFWAVLSIFTSFLGTNLIYVGVIGFQYFGFFHILSIFIILGIGADDLFVFYDSWRLTAFSNYPTLAHRLSDAYSKSTKSMFITSLTTAVAFFSSAISPLLATRSFGVFSGILVFYNYISVIIFFPTVVIVYHTKFENWMWPCFRKCIKEDLGSTDSNLKYSATRSPDDSTGEQSLPNLKDNEIASATTNDSQHNDQNGKPKVIENGFTNKTTNVTLTDKQPESQNGSNIKQMTQTDPKKQKLLVVFFRDKYFKLVTHKIGRWILLSVFGVILIFFAYQASTLEPDNEQLKIYKDDHHYSKAVKANLYLFSESDTDNLEIVYVVWGLENKDRSACHFSAVDCTGSQVFDSSFDPNPVANQIALMNFCDTLFNLTASEASDLQIRTDEDGNMEIACFPRNLNTYLQSLSIGGQNWSLPWNYQKTIDFMNFQTTLYDTSGFTSVFSHWLDIPMQYWMYAGYTDTLTDDYTTFNNLFGEELSSFSSPLKTDSSIYYGNRLKYIAVQINTTINRETTGYTEGIPYAEKWENFVSSQISKMPEGVNKGFQLTRRTWHWIYVQQALADNAIIGIAIGVSLAFPILTLATMNVIVGFLATLSICCTTVCVIGVIPLAGWKLGLLVSLNMCLLVGLAVDYVVHLAEGYHLSLHTDRLGRTRDMLEEMGMSVFSGACTTLGASLFMFIAEVLFFMQFGVFLFCTIGFSLTFSLGLFTVLMGLIGPQGDMGDLRVLFRKIKSKCLTSPKVDVNNSNTD